jgi:peptidoglycan/LPS O-acetylase OafA/YrhL
MESRNLDLLRALAVSLVVICHLNDFVVLPMPTGYSLGTLGKLGVALFFVHTCLVLMHSLERQGGAAGPFFVRRVFRIYPLSVAIVLLTASLWALAGRPIETAALASNLLLVQNLTGHASTPNPLWSLPFEVQMYLALPALYGTTKLRGASVKVAALWAAAIGAGLLLPLLAWVPCFLGGVLAYTLRNRPKLLGPGPLFAAIGAAAVLLPMLVVHESAGMLPAFWVLCLLLGVLIPHCRELRPGPLAFASHKVATYSYGVYLTHLFALAIAFPVRVADPPASQWLVGVGLLAGLAWAAYHAIERPGIRLGAFLASRWRQVRAAVAFQAPL